MLFRVNHKNFLFHMIDYFTADELLGFQYAVVSSGLAVLGSEKENVAKLLMAYPSSGISEQYIDNQDVKLLHRAYYAELKMCIGSIYTDIVQPIIEYYHNIVLINKEVEDVYTDVLVDFIRKEFGMECIDLNELFDKGETATMYIDRDDLHDRNVKLARELAKDKLSGYESNDPGKRYLVECIMTRKEKMAKLKQLGVKRVAPDTEAELNLLLLEAWLDQPD